MAKREQHKTDGAIEKQKSFMTAMGWTLIGLGIVFSITLILAIIGIPLIIIGIAFLLSRNKVKKAGPLFMWARNQELLNKRLERQKSARGRSR